MARRVERGEIWSYRFKSPDKRRPVLVLTRTEVIPLLHTVMVAPITSARRGAPSEVAVGTAEGLKKDSAINFDHVQTVEQDRLIGYLGSLV
jgi:mRNA interferase MazF